jgi:hypothetical protein
MRNAIFFSVMLLFATPLKAQTLSNLRNSIIAVQTDSVRLDSLSIAPGTIRIYSGENQISPEAYNFNFSTSTITWNKNSVAWKAVSSDSVKVTYRVFSFLLGQAVKHKNLNAIRPGVTSDPFYYNPGSSQPDLFRMHGLSRNGSISRGITFGNNQDVFVNSSLNLQLAGKLNENIDILAAITDENIPVQPEGNTQQLQDFDKVFIQLSNERSKLIAGDFELRRPESYFMNFYKKGQGGFFTTQFDPTGKYDDNNKKLLRVGGSLAVSKGKFAKNNIVPAEGNQGPYKLHGTNGENFLIVLSGTEKIYLDGILLQRGLQHDYVIDYNTAEITFTANRIITKDTRIVAEFEYSDKNYARSLIFTNTEFETNKFKVKLNIYSEQDSKNQPLTIDLDSAKKELMAQVGDSIQLALYPTADSVGFNTNIVLYQKKDTLTPDGLFTIYVYSTNADSAYWQVSFSEVGPNRGDYVQDINSANGRVFKWVQRVNNIPQGNYLPVSILVTPKKQQLVTAGIDYRINPLNSIQTEGAVSNNDINLFSKIHKANDAGYAFRMNYKNRLLLQSDTVKGWRIDNQAGYEYAGKNFKPVERYRNVEFERDWNLGSNNIINDEHISTFQTSLIKPSVATFTYQLKSYLKGSVYRGLMNSGGTKLNMSNYALISDVSYLTTQGFTGRTTYLRHNADLSKKIKSFTVGVRENAERNRYIAGGSDSLSASSFEFQELGGYINIIDSLSLRAELSFKNRKDFVATGNDFSEITNSDEATLNTEFTKNPDNTFHTTSTYRILKVTDTTRTVQEPTKTLLNRIDHNANLWKGVITTNTYYEVGTGQERKQEYYYVKVADGQGVYAYIGDENNNGVNDLDEFAIAAFANEANYIRVYILTSNYITTRSNQFSEIIGINPGGLRSIAGKPKFIHRLTDQLSLRLEKKTKDESLLSSLNPFNRNISDSSLVSENTSIRNIFYYNRRSPVFGFDLTWNDNRLKSFLSNGFEIRILRSRNVNIRWNVNRSYLVNFVYENSEKVNQSQFFSARDYRIFTNAFEPKLTFQPGTDFRIAGSYRISKKRNTGGEKATINKFDLEAKYTSVNTGSISAKAAYIEVKYNAEDDNFLSYELLDGYKNGKNMTWGASVQRNLGTSMQLSLTYDGRKLQDSPVVHTGGVQFRAFF